MKKIRLNVFETNSSSTHSISFSNNADYTDFPVIVDGVITIGKYGETEFGWEEESYSDADTKLNYAYLLACYCEYTTELIEIIEEHTGAKVKIDLVETWDNDDARRSGYIDHQSVSYSDLLLTNKESVLNFIFNPKTILHTDNDNH